MPFRFFHDAEGICFFHQEGHEEPEEKLKKGCWLETKNRQFFDFLSALRVLRGNNPQEFDSQGDLPKESRTRVIRATEGDSLADQRTSEGGSSL
jgi:hypothetical protein